MQLQKYTPHLALIATNVIWGLTYPLYHITLSRTHITPLYILTATMIVSALMSLVPLLWEPYERVRREDVISILAGSIMIAVLRKGIFIYSLSLTTPIEGSIISTLTPIIVLVISIVIGIERFSMSKLMGLILGLGGAIGVIITSSTASMGHSSTALLGNIIVLCCATISAIYMVWFKSLLKRYSPSTIMRWMFCTAAILITPFGAKSLLTTPLHTLSPHILLALAYLIIMPTYLPNLLLNYGLKYVQPTVSGTYTYLQPLLAGAFSILLHIDTPHIITLLFAALIFIGVGVVIKSKK